MRHMPLLVVGGEAEGEPLEVVSPYDGSTLATLERGGAQAVEKALSTAYALYRNRDGWLPARKRIAILQRAADIMRERRMELAREAAAEGGKPLTDSLVEVDRAINGVELCATAAAGQAGDVIPMGVNAASGHRLALTVHEPAGVVVAVSAFNHPLNLIVHQIGPAVAAGAPAIVKPAADTPLSCMRFVQILHEAGLPPAWAQALVTTTRELATALVVDPRVAFFTFIGSGRVGWSLRSQLAPGTRCALEHGGVAPVIVAADADIDEALPLLMRAGFYHAGQVCVSVQRVFAEESVARALAEQMAAAARTLVVGDPLSAETEVGPLIREREVERVHEWVTEAVDAGAELLSGGTRVGRQCYAPTVLYNPPANSRVSTEEVFGPVVCIYPYEDMDEALERANCLPFSFQAAVFSQDINTCLRAARRLDAVAVMINDHTAFRVDWMPFGGTKTSGLGTGGIGYTMRDMQVEKLIVVRSRELE